MEGVGHCEGLEHGAGVEWSLANLETEASRCHEIQGVMFDGDHDDHGDQRVS